MSIYQQTIHALEQRFDREAHEFAELLPHRHHGTSTETPAAPATMTTTTPEVPMPLLDEIKTDAKALVAKLEAVDEEAASKLESISGNAQAMGVFNDLATLAGVPGLPGDILGTAGVFLKTLVSIHAPAPAEAPPAPAEASEPVAADVPQAVPAGPVVAGQA